MPIGDSFREVLDQIPRWGKATLWLATAVGIGVVLAGWLGLPDRVEANTEAISQNSIAISANTAKLSMMQQSDSILSHDIRRVICILTLDESTRPIDATKLCP